MPAPAKGKYTRVDEAGWLIEYAEESDTVAGAPGTYAEVGCIVGTPSFTDNWDENEDSGAVNWCELNEPENDNYKDASLGRRNGGLSYTVDMVLDSTVQLQLKADFNAKRVGFLKVTAKNVDSDVSSVLYDVQVKTPEFVPVPTDTGRSQWNARHRFVLGKPAAGWPTA